MYKIGVYIGRFQPFHNGHKAVIEKMCEANEKNVIIIGSLGTYSERNPFRGEDRSAMITAAFGQQELNKNNIQLCYVTDFPGRDEDWIQAVIRTVEHFFPTEMEREEIQVTVWGCHKDCTTNYLEWFPKEWAAARMPLRANGVSATDIRKLIAAGDLDAVKGHMPEGAFNKLKEILDDKSNPCHGFL